MFRFLRRPPSNVFVLSTGRSGTSTFIQACQHISNYTASHESLVRAIGDDRFAYPERHIEADNRLSWFLGSLDERYGKAPLYVHLKRDTSKVVESFVRRRDKGIMRAFNPGIVVRTRPAEQAHLLSRFYVDTVTANIDHFLSDKPRAVVVWLEDAADWFPTFWDEIAAEGNFHSALAEFSVRYNASDPA